MASLAEINALRSDILSRLVPYSIVPMATANAMLIMGSHRLSGESCSFPLPEYLVITGSISISLVAVGVFGRFLLNLALGNGAISAHESYVIKVWEVFASLIGALQITVLLAGMFILLPNLNSWQHEFKNLPHYCEFDIMVFSIIFLSVVWLLIAITLLSAGFILLFGSNEDNSQDDKDDDEASDERRSKRGLVDEDGRKGRQK